MNALIDDLRRPERYPKPRPESVTVKTTHGSWVFLAGELVYKVKRPVDFGFMDFSTPRKRRHFCEEEVRLNRRLAPSVYLEVVEVRRGKTGYTLVGPGEVVDYAVKMRRLPDTDSAQKLVEQDRLGHAELDRVASVVAAFHAAHALTEPRDYLSDMRQNVDENFRQVLPYEEMYVDRDLFRRVLRWQEEHLATWSDELQGRGPAGRLVDGHGDLRLEHVYLRGSEPIIIDCIEFNERFRRGDAALDIAFLAMDLDYNRRPDLGEWLLARYARASGDFLMYRLVDLYLSYRAWVRGKVACFVAGDESTPSDKTLRKQVEAREFFELGESYTRGPRGDVRPVVVVAGGVASGKSTLAGELGRELRLPVISSDVVRKHLAGVPLLEPGGADLYTDDMTRRTYERLFAGGQAVLDSGRGVVLDATFRRRDLREQAQKLAARAGRPFLAVEARCDEATARRRLRDRAILPSVSDADEAVYERHGGRFDPVDEVPAERHLVVDTSRPHPHFVEEVRRRSHD